MNILELLRFQVFSQIINRSKLRVRVMLLVLAEPWCVCSDLVSQGNRTWLPAGDGFRALFAAAAFVFQMHCSAERGAYIAERSYRLMALRALDLEQVGMRQVASNK